ncbi:molybdopterin-dependent oxidoreductase [Fulvivirgaceae bacterium BMA12]|uniref:Molybdopterin-dependent oxidoreductase n=1 Tax=Agaribacillus aureus TaxID=3051825 RepID=A0ABT8L8A9_9BACT|nr:molybdopterin-dependent oxidoreductase [Fulvivirgaceae bacterium BMA12]
MEKVVSSARRKFLKRSGSLVIGIPFLPGCLSSTEGARTNVEPLQRDLDPTFVKAWLEILKDGTIRIFTGKMELGQGISVAVAQVAAEELNTDINKVSVRLAETEVTPDEGFTVGSNSIETSAMSIRYAAATAREQLLQLAAKQLKVTASDLHVKDGMVYQKGGKTISFYMLLDGKQLDVALNRKAKIKPKNQRQWVGKPIPRKELELMVRGEQVFIQDLRFEGMVHARIVRPASYHATLKKVNEDALRIAVPGIHKLVVNGSFIGLIAADEYDAVKGQAYLKKNTQWSVKHQLRVGESLQQQIEALPNEQESAIEKGNAFQPSKETIKATYFKPYIMHGSIGPSCALAIFKDGKLTIWSHSQGVYPLRKAISALVGLTDEQVHIKGVPGAGCYGHNGADDVAADVAILAMAYPGKHIRLQWSRSDEHGWEPFGSAMIMSLQAKLNSVGKISDWYGEIWSDTHTARPRAASNLLAAQYLSEPLTPQPPGWKGGSYRNAAPYYHIPNVNIDIRSFKGPLRTSALRSLGAYANIFALESFMDELAEKAGKDPVTFRIMNSTDERSVAVLERLRDITSKDTLSDGEGVGYGFTRYGNGAAYCSVAAKLTVTVNGEIKLRKLWAVIDAGEVINLDGLKNQTEGGMIQAASWTLKEAVKYDETHVTSLNWNSYPILRFTEIPEVHVTVIDRPSEQPVGAGEAAQGPTAAAIANAVYQASGKRIRSLPIPKIPS